MTFPIHTEHIENTINDMIYHDHHSLEFVYCINGEAIYYINNKKIFLNKGTALFINRHVLHKRLSSSAHLMTLSIEREAFSMNGSLLNYFDSYFNTFHSPYLLINDYSIHRLITQLYGLLNIPEWEPFRILSSASLLCQNIIELLPESLPLENYDLLLDMIHYLQKNLSHKITIQDLADETGICRSRCCSLFSAYLDITPMAYLNDLRLAYSIQLLKTDASIVSISKKCGFKHPSYFNTQFKKRYHMTPLEYRHSF